MKNLFNFYNNKRIFITGHNGFKGTWLTLMLKFLNCKVFGFSEKNYHNSFFFNKLKLGNIIDNVYGDINNYDLLNKSIQKFKPELIFHMAAQPLVSKSIDNPYNTFYTNTNGTLNILEIIRKNKYIKSSIIITSDKCYKNKNFSRGYNETDELGGEDPYSASKAGAEIIFQSYKKTFFDKENIAISSVRAGNVIGGGDWSIDRIVPDFYKCLKSNKELKIRMPNSTRPWQHVLEPLWGYLILANKQHINPKKFSGSWNFGPNKSKSVIELVNNLNSKCGNAVKLNINKSNIYNETKLLKLNSKKSNHYLGWKQKLNFNKTVEFTSNWYLNSLKKSDIELLNFSIGQIQEYLDL